MVAAKESCPTKTMLLVAWQKAAEVYSRAVADLTRKIGVVSKQEYARLSEAAENARKHALQAQENLEVHTAEHGCDGDGEVAA